MSFPRDLADAIVRRFEGKSPSGYAQLANIVGLEGESFEISSGLVLRRANSVEAQEIRDAIEFYYPQRNQNPYETVVSARETHEESFEVITYSTLPPEAWRYVVVDHLGGNVRTHALVEASFFTPWPLELGFHAGNGAGATGFGTNRGLDRILAHPASDAGMVTLTAAQLQDLTATFRLWTGFTNEPLDLRRPIRQFGEVLDLERNSALRFLALFTIIESLLTHDPKPSDPSDSLTRQVMKKMVLLSHRSQNPPPYAEYFGTTSPDTIWKKLYGVRSAIAHGSEPDFAREFSLLRNLENATKFLSVATAVVLRRGLEEPLLIADLREC